MLQKSDARNTQLRIWVGDKLYSKEDAKISVFDSVVQGGDAVWEGLRLYKEGVFLLNRHLNRLFASAHAMAFEKIPSREFIQNALSETLRANGMEEDVHIRLTLTRGKKITSGMDPRLNQFGCTLIVLAEWKPPVYDNDRGINVFTSSIRRNNPAFLDSKIHHNNLINNILAKIQSTVAGKDAALMLDKDGFAAELNGTNLFMIKDGALYTPYADACLHGITRGLIIELAEEKSIKCREKNISLTELYNADMLFCTGTMGELTPIVELDGRVINKSELAQDVFNKLLKAFHEKRQSYCEPF
jgi:branched-chain amino acid aminotransferase